MINQPQNQQVEKEVIKQIIEFTDCLELNFLNFKKHVVDYNYEREDPPAHIKTIFNHLYIAQSEILKTSDYIKDNYSKNVKLTSNEIDLIKDSLEERLEQGIRNNRHLATDKIDLSPLFELKEKFKQLDDSQVNDNEIPF